jgi:N-acetylglutamate synthase-like GNAT family acetyltransferase
LEEFDFSSYPGRQNLLAIRLKETGQLLNMVVEDMRTKGISPIYLVTDHSGFYERYGWELLCLVQSEGQADMSRMYIHR